MEKIAGYVITRQLDHRSDNRSDKYITCDYVCESTAMEKYREVVDLLEFPQELTCRKAWLMEYNGKRYYTERE